MKEDEARKLANKIREIVIAHSQWIGIKYIYKSNGLDQIVIEDISIKIKK